MAGREAFKEGLAWRIGDGVSVDIRNQKWIPTLLDMQVQHPDVIPYGFQSVHQLINHETRHWKEEVVREVFSIHDAEHILSISLAQMEIEDTLY